MFAAPQNASGQCEHTRLQLIPSRRQLGHKDSAITLKVYARWPQDDSRRCGVDGLDEMQLLATPAQPSRDIAVGENAVSDWQESGEPRWNRTINPQIKSLLLCQLS
jgi:hypothetical protein